MLPSQLSFQGNKNNLVPVVIPQDVPIYRVGDEKFFGTDASGHDRLYETGEFIEHEGEPSLGMEPMNALAMANMTALVEKLDRFGQAVADKTGSTYTGYSSALSNAHAAAQAEGKSVAFLGDKETTPILGGKQKREAKTRTVHLQQEVPVIKRVGRPRKSEANG